MNIRSGISAGKLMDKSASGAGELTIIEKDRFQKLIEILIKRGYGVIGPTVRDKAVIYDKIESVDELPIGFEDEQEAGKYRAGKRDGVALFGYTVGPNSWKKYLFPPSCTLWHGERNAGGFKVNSGGNEIQKMAFLGVRACDLNAIAIQDKIFCQGEYRDLEYQRRRQNNFIIAVNCTRAGGTCFCASMKTGPRAEAGFDLAVTEIIGEHKHSFIFQAGSEPGREILSELSGRPASDEEKGLGERLIARATAQMGRTLDTGGIKELLYNNSEHPRWEDVASRCLSCGNCTMVCPTCFCSNVEDYTDLKGENAERRRRWDSCFTLEHSYIHGGSVRSSAKARYRQWLTHKLASWIDQFGVSGCVGCGRCITWCPVGIDITEEVDAIRRGSGSALKATK